MPRALRHTPKLIGKKPNDSGVISIASPAEIKRNTKTNLQQRFEWFGQIRTTLITMEDIHTLALSSLFAPQIQQNDTLQRYLRTHTRQPRPNAPKITKIRETKVEKEPPACRQASSSLSRRLHPDHPRRAEHSKLVVSNQRSDLRRVWRAGHMCGM